MKKIALLFVSIALLFSFSLTATASAAKYSPNSSYCKAKDKKFGSVIGDYSYYLNLSKASKTNKSYYYNKAEKYAKRANKLYKEGQKDCGKNFGSKYVIKLS